jgi:hypothetical protein
MQIKDAISGHTGKNQVSGILLMQYMRIPFDCEDKLWTQIYIKGRQMF